MYIIRDRPAHAPGAASSGLPLLPPWPRPIGTAARSGRHAVTSCNHAGARAVGCTALGVAGRAARAAGARAHRPHRLSPTRRPAPDAPGRARPRSRAC